MRKMWEKLVLAARTIAAIENPADVFVVSSRPYGQRAILKYAAATGAVAIAGRFTPGTFTNYIQVRMSNPGRAGIALWIAMMRSIPVCQLTMVLITRYSEQAINYSRYCLQYSSRYVVTLV